ncbi:unnamed protein product [Parascedosporium putredinis]|uniref:Uncharacterized protein n=1 Tax=Parascedosporium putredinis TaxID=1442378 RepID=A0A9P1MGC0_9PEZI|nr:unnamed protein product [Parascedosporium putredinis]CAI8004161.1 unnamed protein product [Parascedosporium putredinis]
MFPPIEASVLENNPEFAKLYATLTTSILNPDGTTKADPRQRAGRQSKSGPPPPLLRTYTKTLIALIHALESKHSSPSRSLQLRAAHLSLASRSADLTAQLNLLLLHSNTVYPPELAEYGIGVEGDEAEAKERTLREMARVYKSMKEEAKDVKGDLERLRGR